MPDLYSDQICQVFRDCGAQVHEAIAAGASKDAAVSVATDLIKSKFVSDAADLLADLSFEWHRSAFSSIEISHKLAASLMCTAVSPEDARNIQLPWDCFMIAVPMLFDQQSYHKLFVWKCGGGILAIGVVSLPQLPSGCQFGFQMFSAKDMGELCDLRYKKPAGEDIEPPWETNEDSGAFDILPGGPEERERALIARLILGVCIELDHSGLTPSNSSPKEVRTKRGIPKSWVFKLCRPVSLDLRAPVAEYIRGTAGKKPTVQILVRGHHKYQPHGPERKLRKWIHIEPYWRGPDTAPIALRSHIIKDTAH